MSSQLEKQALGKGGAIFESGTTAVTADICAIQIIADAVFSSISWPELSGDALTGVSILAGTTLVGDIKGFTLTSGSVLAYKADV